MTAVGTGIDDATIVVTRYPRALATALRSIGEVEVALPGVPWAPSCRHGVGGVVGAGGAGGAVTMLGCVMIPMCLMPVVGIPHLLLRWLGGRAGPS